MDTGARSKVHVPYQRLEQEAQVPTPSAATGTAASIGNIGTVSGIQSPTVVGAGQVTVNYNLPPETAGATGKGDVPTSSPNANPSSPSPSPIPSTQASGVPATKPQHSQTPDQEPRLAAPSYQDVGNKTRDFLKGVYKTTGSYVQLLPGVDDDQMQIAGIYTKVKLETREGVAVVTTGETVTNSDQRGEIINSTEYAKIFRLRTGTGELIKRLIFFGMGGVGKSTIFDKIAYDWADEASEILKLFKLVFLLKLCALTQESNLVDSTFDQLVGEKSGIEKDELDEFIQAHPNEVLILLDGFDEMKTRELNAAFFGSILKALNRKVYRECVICVSTRPSHLQTLMSKSLVQNPCTHVEVLGFTDEDVNDYVRKFCGKDTDHGNALIQTIRTSNAMSDLANNPMLLLLMCLLWRESKKLPKTTSRLFSEAVDYMFTRKQEIFGEDVPETLVAIGKTALQGLIGAYQKFSFQEDEFESKALDVALKAGILTQQRVIKNRKSHNNIQFMHKTMQEYCAAMYLQSVHMSNRGLAKRAAYKVAEFGEFHKNLKQLCLGIEGVVSNDYLLRFCCGDNEKCMKDIVKFLDRKFDKDRDRPMYQSGVIQAISRNCVYESQSENAPRCLTSDSLITSTITVKGNNDLRSLVYLFEIMCRSADSRSTQLVPVETIMVFRVSSVKDLAFALGCMKTLRNLKFFSCPLAKGDLEKTLTSLKCHKLLTDLCIKWDSTLGGRAIEWAPHIKNLTSLNKLEISNCELQGTDIEHIASSVSDMPNLTDLILTDNPALGASTKKWSRYLLRVEQKHTLDLSNYSLTWEDIDTISVVLDHIPTLTNLNLSGNTSLGGLAKMWAKNLLRFMNIQTLNLSKCTLQWRDIDHIALAVGDMPSLTDLILTDNPTLGMSPEKWSHYLLRVKQKDTLDLSNSLLTWEDINTICLVLVNIIPTLTNLSIAGNTALGESANLWAKNLLRFTNLQTLNLSNCTLQRPDIGHIASAVGDMPRLTDLILTDNPALGMSTEKLSRYLLRVKQKHTLDLSNSSLTWEDINTISVVFDCIPALTNLNLTGNTALGGWANLWAKNLFRFTNIQTLNLSNCTLRWRDIKNIAWALGDMPRLTDLILTDNPALGVWTEKLSRYLLRVKQKHTLDLSNFSLLLEDINMISVVLRHIPALTNLNLTGNTSLGGSADWWAKSSSRFKTIQTLNLSNCALQVTDIKHIAWAVSDLPRLTDLILTDNPALGKSTEMWSCCLLRMKQKHTLDLSNFSLSCEDFCTISLMLDYIPAPTNLILAGNRWLGGSADLWAKNLLRFSKLKMLRLSFCSLKSTDIEHIASTIGVMHRLNSLTFAHNNALGELTKLWSKELPKMTHLNKLDLSLCNLTLTDIEHIASAVESMPRLTDLILTHTWSLGGTAEFWAQELPKMKHLHWLDLSGCILTPTDIEHIASAVGVMPRLTDLILTYNTALSKSVELWAKELLKMEHLHRLDLSSCNLTLSDVYHINSAVGCMPRPIKVVHLRKIMP